MRRKKEPGQFGMMKNSDLVILSLRFLLDIHVEKPSGHLDMSREIQTNVLTRDKDLGVVSTYIARS